MANDSFNAGDEFAVDIETFIEGNKGIARKDQMIFIIYGANEAGPARVKVSRILNKIGFADYVGPASSEEVQAPVTKGAQESKEGEQQPEEAPPEESEETPEEPQDESKDGDDAETEKEGAGIEEEEGEDEKQENTSEQDAPVEDTGEQEEKDQQSEKKSTNDLNLPSLDDITK